MLHATSFATRGQWPRGEAAGSVTADFDSRHRRRVRLRCDDGRDVLLDLERAAALREGDALRVDGGRWIEIHAAPEALIEIGCDEPDRLMRIAWHIGNRHCPAEIHADSILIRDDHVMADMLRRLGATVTPCRRPFDPEAGAYTHEHDHDRAG